MRRVVLALLLLSALTLLACPVLGEKRQTQSAGEQEQADEHERTDEREHEPEQDDDSDSAPFMIVVQHGNGHRCGGSLVSLRTALTSAWCVRGQIGGDPRELWALAPAVPPARPVARRVARVALAAGADSNSSPPHLEPEWTGAALDIAVLELEAPFGGGARSRPILMATRPEDCDMSAMCHVVRAIGTAPRLRIVDAVMVPGERCSAVARGWSSLRESALCLAGPELCMTDRGAGVVCDGKLCGVLSRSATTTNSTPDTTQKTVAEAAASNLLDKKCGDIHVAQSVSRWRRFLHCAHTLRACGSGGECAQLCSERQLMVMQPDDGAGGASGGDGGGELNADERASGGRRAEPDTDPPDTSPPTTLPPETTTETQVTVIPTSSLAIPDAFSSTRTGRSRTSTRLTPTHTAVPVTLATVALQAPVASGRPSFEFEPNRADFKGDPARTSRVYLKAGEYGDNAADYSGEESVLAPTSSTSPMPSSSSNTVAAGLVSEMAARQSAAVTKPQVHVRSCATTLRLHQPFLFVTLIYVL